MGLLKGEYKMELYGMSNIEDMESFLIVVFNINLFPGKIFFINFNLSAEIR